MSKTVHTNEFLLCVGSGGGHASPPPLSRWRVTQEVLRCIAGSEDKLLEEERSAASQAPCEVSFR
eukprot:4632082-Amphidinium_carterae.2